MAKQEASSWNPLTPDCKYITILVFGLNINPRKEHTILNDQSKQFPGIISNRT
jgi:hypothetical protein